jgi:prepilin-type N-terminal cleavage/methylation domain-containing protein
VIRERPYGFTLVELIVVIALIAVFLAFSLPRFKTVDVLNRQNREVDDLARLITQIKHRAIQENRDFSLYLDIDDARVWFTHSDMDDPAMETARSEATSFSTDLRITDMVFAGQSRYGGTHPGESGPERIIRFSRHGYSDGVILHLTDPGGSPVSLKVAPFLMETETVPRHISYDDCL